MTVLRRADGDRIAATILLLVSILLLVTSVNYHLFNGNAPGPGLFPAIISGGLLVLAVLWLIQGAGKSNGQPIASEGPVRDDKDGQPSETSVGSSDDDAVIDRDGWRRIGFVVVWTAIPMVLLDRAGFILAMTLYVGGLLVVVARNRPWIAVLMSAIGSLLCQIGANALGITLPDPFGLVPLLGV